MTTGILRNSEATDALDLNDFTARKIHNAETALRHIFRLCLRLTGLFRLSLRWRDSEHEIGRIRHKTSACSSRIPMLSTRFDVGSNQFAITILRDGRIHNPLTIWGNLLALDPLPGIVVIMCQRSFTHTFLGSDRYSR